MFWGRESFLFPLFFFPFIFFSSWKTLYNILSASKSNVCTASFKKLVRSVDFTTIECACICLHQHLEPSNWEHTSILQNLLVWEMETGLESNAKALQIRGASIFIKRRITRLILKRFLPWPLRF